MQRADPLLPGRCVRSPATRQSFIADMPAYCVCWKTVRGWRVRQTEVHRPIGELWSAPCWQEEPHSGALRDGHR